MGHDAEQDAARYLGGQMSARRRGRFSQHLLDCDACWREVVGGQEGRRLLEAARTVAPAHLRERVRVLALTAEESGPVERRPRLSPLAAVAMAVASVIVAGGIWTVGSRVDRVPQDPQPVQAAIADFRARTLPGRQVPDDRAPDLSGLRLLPMGAGSGSYDGLAVDGYAYRDDAGRRIVLFMSEQPFPTAVDAEALAGADGPWTVQRGNTVVLCARSPHALLVVGEDGELVRSTAVALGVL